MKVKTQNEIINNGLVLGIVLVGFVIIKTVLQL